MTTKKEQIKTKAIELLKENSAGIRYSQLVNNIKENFPDIPINTIRGIIWNLDATTPMKSIKLTEGYLGMFPLKRLR